MHGLDVIVERNRIAAMYPNLTDCVIVRNIFSNGEFEHPAIVTRRVDRDTINVMILPDGGVPHAVIGVRFFQTKDEAEAHLASLGDRRWEVNVAYWATPRCDHSTLK